MNVDETWTRYDMAGLHRGKDPGAGAITGYHGREAFTTRNVSAGSEIFEGYGEVSETISYILTLC